MTLFVEFLIDKNRIVKGDVLEFVHLWHQMIYNSHYGNVYLLVLSKAKR